MRLLLEKKGVWKIHPQHDRRRSFVVVTVNVCVWTKWCGRRDLDPGRRLSPKLVSWEAEVLDQARLRPRNAEIRE